MSSQSFQNLPTTPIVRSNTFATNPTQNTNILFSPPFPAGITPFVQVQNTQGTTWQTIIFTTSNTTNTGFTITQYNITNPGSYQTISCDYIAVGFPQ
jgi:hypothetical protein